LKTRSDDPLKLGRQATTGDHLADQREGECSVWQNPDAPLETLIAPNEYVQLVTGVDSIGHSGRCRGQWLGAAVRNKTENSHDHQTNQGKKTHAEHSRRRNAFTVLEWHWHFKLLVTSNLKL
jgi:hypothetical protein